MPPGYHPFDVEKEWGRLHVAILERERLLRTEFERQDGARLPPHALHWTGKKMAKKKKKGKINIRSESSAQWCNVTTRMTHFLMIPNTFSIK